MSKITNDGLTPNPVWHRMLYSYCADMATVGVKGLKTIDITASVSSPCGPDG